MTARGQPGSQRTGRIPRFEARLGNAGPIRTWRKRLAFA
jgi:hypothetical protein